MYMYQFRANVTQQPNRIKGNIASIFLIIIPIIIAVQPAFLSYLVDPEKVMEVKSFSELCSRNEHLLKRMYYQFY
jgi:hypothetical protein